VKAALEPRSRRYATIPNIFDSLLRGRYFTSQFAAAAQARIVDCAEKRYQQCDSPDYLDHLLDIDARLWLPDDLLTKVDRATMAFSLEARVPYLDHAFYGWCARLEPSAKVDGGERKRILKRLALRYLPPDIVHREKQGFMMPLDRWLARELAPDLARSLGPQGFARRGVLRPEAISRLLAEHASGRKNHAMRLWVLLILEHWLARYEPDFAIA
jgi:asparagine synthase (glutamine-hydrolysing)